MRMFSVAGKLGVYENDDDKTDDDDANNNHYDVNMTSDNHYIELDDLDGHVDDLDVLVASDVYDEAKEADTLHQNAAARSTTEKQTQNATTNIDRKRDREHSVTDDLYADRQRQQQRRAQYDVIDARCAGIETRQDLQSAGQHVCR